MMVGFTWCSCTALFSSVNNDVLLYSMFTLAAGHGTVQYGMVKYAYFFQFKQVLFQAEMYKTGLTWPW